jgi:hypothetical protein
VRGGQLHVFERNALNPGIRSGWLFGMLVRVVVNSIGDE